MSNNNRSNLVDVLNNYFNRIVYIDDTFEINRSVDDFVSVATVEAVQDVDFDPTASITIFPSKENLEESSGIFSPLSIEDNISKLLSFFRDNNMLVFPYRYTPATSINSIVNFVKNTNLVILDWLLKETDPLFTLEIVEKIKDDHSLRFILIYTNEEDIYSIQEQILSRFDEISDVVNGERNLIRVNSTYIMISNKFRDSLKNILNNFNELLIDEYGYLFVSFFDIAQQIQNATGKVLIDFMYPLETLITLQLRSNCNDNKYFEELLKMIIINHISDSVSINEGITDEIDLNLRNKIDNLKSNDFDNIIEKIKKWVNNNKFYDDIKENVYTLLNSFNKESFDCLIDAILSCPNHIWDTIKVKENLNNAIGRLSLSKNDKNLLKSNFEVFLLSCLFKNSEDFNIVTNSMLKLIKVIQYEESSLHEILEELSTYNSDNTTMLINKFKSGDVLAHENGAYLLCITPACDVFRPSKVEYTLKFLKGEVTSDILSSDSQGYHITTLPYKESIINIKWRLFDEKNINLLKSEDQNELRDYSRPYRLQEQYLNQILSKYLSFWARSGVDELFLKNKDHRLGLNINKVISM